jgi:hypothetical protein
MAAHIKKGYRLSQEHYAYIYAVHPNTIHRWQKQKLPLDDPWNLMRLISIRSWCPMSMLRKGAVAILADYGTLARD